VRAAASVIATISPDCHRVRGITSVDVELFLLLELHRDNQVAVYCINDYQLLRHLHVRGYKPDSCSDMTSCVQRKCLYMSDWDNSCIHRYELASSDTSEWWVPGKPLGLSVTPNGNLLVTTQSQCWDKPDKLVEFSADNGESVREIALQSGIEYPHDSVQLTTGQFVVCHGLLTFSSHGVCVVGDNGKVIRSYYGPGGSDVGQLKWPRHFAVDKDSQFMFVADEENNNASIVLLRPTLEFVRYIEGLSCPRRLYFHQSTRRLFVGQRYDRTVRVIQL